MPRYLIVRTFEIDEEAMPEVGRRSKEIAKEEFPEITWETATCPPRRRLLQQFCVYRAPDPEALRSHGKRLGAHRIDDIWEIAGDVTPADFPAAL